MNNYFLTISGSEWKAVKGKSKASLISRANDEKLDIRSLDSDGCYVEQIPLSFYKKCEVSFFS